MIYNDYYIPKLIIVYGGDVVVEDGVGVIVALGVIVELGVTV